MKQIQLKMVQINKEERERNMKDAQFFIHFDIHSSGSSGLTLTATIGLFVFL